MEKKIGLEPRLEFIRNFKRVGKLKKLNKTPLLSEINFKIVFKKKVKVRLYNETSIKGIYFLLWFMTNSN